jgi:transcriptional regulator with XRE-family HTH domain
MPISAQTPDDVVFQELGARIRAARLNRNLSQAKLAGEAGIGRVTLQRLEEGKVNASLSVLIRLLRALDLSEGLDQLVPAHGPSPLEEMERRGQPRRRARASRPKDQREKGWRWGDEESN